MAPVILPERDTFRLGHTTAIQLARIVQPQPRSTGVATQFSPHRSRPQASRADLGHAVPQILPLQAYITSPSTEPGAKTHEAEGRCRWWHTILRVRCELVRRRTCLPLQRPPPYRNESKPNG